MSSRRERVTFRVIIDRVMTSKMGRLDHDSIKKEIDKRLKQSGYGESHMAMIRVSHIDSLKNRMDVGVAPRPVVDRLSELVDDDV